MKKVLYIITIILCLSCGKSISSPPIKGVVLDSISGKTLSDVIVKYVDDMGIVEEYKTNSSGKFIFIKKEKKEIMSLEGRPREFVLEFFKKGYHNYKLEKGTRNGYSKDTLNVDTIKLKPLLIKKE